MAILGGAGTVRSTSAARNRRPSGHTGLRSARIGRAGVVRAARVGARRAPSTSQGGTGSRSYSGGGGRGVSRPSGGGGISVARAAGGQARAVGTAVGRPRYSGPPAPTAAMIAQLAAQIGDINRRYKEAGATYTAGLGEAGSARKAFLQQLGDYYTQQQNQTAADFQSRGLLQSGLYNEALANLGKERAAQQGQYEANYRSSLADLLRTLTTTRSELSQQKATLSDRYNQQRADRARILKLMGG